MIITRVKSNHPSLIILLVVLAVLLWLDGFLLHELTLTQGAAPLYVWVGEFFTHYPGLSVALSFILMLVQAFMFNRVIAGKNLVDRNSWLPALMYIVLMSSSFSLFGMHPVWFANFFLILALDKMFEVFREETVTVEIFNVGFFISLASLFYLPALALILLLLAALLIYYLVNIRDILAALIGLALPYGFLALYYYWFDLLGERTHNFTLLISQARTIPVPLEPFQWVFIICLALITLVAISRLYLTGMRDKAIRVRKRMHVLLAYLIIATAAITLAGPLTSIHTGIIALPLAAILAAFFQDNRKMMLNEIIFTLLMLLVLVGKLVRL
jgi:hypothetical protein